MTNLSNPNSLDSMEEDHEISSLNNNHNTTTTTTTTTSSTNINIIDDDNYDGGGDEIINNKNENEKSLKNRKNRKLEKGLTRFYKPPHLIRNKKTQRLISLGWGILTILISGTLYGFSLISNEIRDKLDFSQTDIGVAISIGDVGIYIGLTVGYFFDLFGPFYTSLLATAFYILGYIGVWCVVNGTLINSVYLLSFFLFIIGQGSHASFTASIVPNVHNFSITHRGKISGLLVGMFALSSGVFGIIYKSTFKKHNNVEGYLLFLAILLSSVSFIASFLVRVVKIDGVEEPELEDDRIEREKQEQEHDNNLKIPHNKNINDHDNSYDIDEEEESASGNLSNIGGSSNSIGSSIGGGSGTNNGDILNDSVVIKKEGKLNFILNNITNNNNNINDMSRYKLLNKIEDFDNSLANEFNPNFLDGKRDISGLKLLKTLEFWLMWIIYFFAGGASLMFLNNIAVMGQALKKPDSVHSDLVIVFAACNLVGRVGMGFISDFLSKKNFSRFWCAVLSSTIISITHFITAFELKGMFYIGTILTAIGYGGMVSIMVSLASLRFGSRRFGINFGFLAIASASSSLLFNFFSSKIYDNLSITGKCLGSHCFRTSFLISSICNLGAIFVGFFIIYYNRKTLLSKNN